MYTSGTLAVGSTDGDGGGDAGGDVGDDLLRDAERRTMFRMLNLDDFAGTVFRIPTAVHLSEADPLRFRFCVPACFKASER